MRRAAILGLILAAGCAGGGHEARDPTSSWSLNPAASDKYEAAHPSATPRGHGDDETGWNILNGIFDVFFGGGN